MKEKAYRALVRPLLEYTCSTWEPHNIQLVRSLEVIQQRGCSLDSAQNSRSSSVDETRTELDWLSLQSRSWHRRARLANFCMFRHGLITFRYKPKQQASARRPHCTHPLPYTVPYCPTDSEVFILFQNHSGLDQPARECDRRSHPWFLLVLTVEMPMTPPPFSPSHAYPPQWHSLQDDEVGHVTEEEES